MIERSIGRESTMKMAIRAAPAALATLIGVLGLVFQTTPIRPYHDGAWAQGDLVGLFVLGLVVGVLNRSVRGLVGTIVGATAAVAIQLYVLSESASYTPTVVASLGEPAWSRQVPGALAIGIASLIGGYLVGAFAGRVPASLRSHGAPTRPSPRFIRQGLIAGLTLAAAAVLALALVRATATSAYVPGESQPVLRVSVNGDRIVAVTPDTVPAGRVVIDIRRTGATQERWISIAGPLTPDLEAVLQAGNDPLSGPWSGLWPVSDEPVHRAEQVDLWPGPYAIVISTGYPQVGPEETALPAVPALDARRMVATGPEPASSRAATGGPVAGLGHLFGIAVAGWGAAGSLLVARQGRSRGAAAMAGLVVVGLMWVLVGLTIGQSHSPF